MSVENPRAHLLAALAADPPLSRLELHALLYRVAGRWASALHNCLREPEWDEWAAAREQQVGKLLVESDWAARLAAHIRWISERDTDTLLVLGSVVLRGLDRFHREHRSENATREAVLPPALGGGRTLFLPPPQSPIEGLIPAARRLDRGTGDLENDVRTMLDLWWLLVPLEDQAVQIETGTLDPVISKTLSVRLQRTGDLRVGLCSPVLGFDYTIWADPERCHAAAGTPYRFVGLPPGSLAGARQVLEEVVATCAQERIDVLCFPELTLDTTLLGDLSRLLKLRNPDLHPLLVVAGSFHVDAGLAHANRCSVLDGYGDLLFCQDKCKAYGIPAAQARRMRPELRAKLGIDERGGYEDIGSGSALRLTETAIGRLATPICLDFCGTQLLDLLVSARANLLFVPAMTPRMGPFYERARDLGTSARATTFVVNSAWLLQQIGLRSRRQRNLGYVPARKGLRGGGRPISDHLALFTIRELLGLP